MNSLYSHFDTNPIKEYETLELEQQLLTGVNIHFSYYPIITREIQRKPEMIYSIYRGNTSQPNIILNDKNYFPTYYQTSELCIYGNRLHKGSHSAELVIKHEPISSSVEPLYVCFFLHKNAPLPVPPLSPFNNTSNDISHASTLPISSFEKTPIETFESPANQLKLIIENNDPVEIDLSSFLESYQVFMNETQKPDLPVSWKLYKSITRENGKSCFVILIQKPIWIDFSIFNKIPSNKKAVSPFITYNCSMFANNINKITNKKPFSYKEGFVTVSGTGNSGTGYALDTENNNQMVCEVIDDNINENQEINFYQVPVNAKSNKSQEKMNSLLAGLYFVLGAMIVASSMILTPMLFDSVYDYFKMPNNPKTAKLWLALSALLIVCIGGVCIGVAFFKKPTDTMLIIIGVIIGIYAMLACVGTLAMSKVINTPKDNNNN